MESWINSLTFAKLEFTIEALTPLILPVYKGSTFRGAFGSQFKKVVCINRKGDCEKCILSSNCPYYQIFETPNSLNLDWFSSPKLPHPFILEPPVTERERFEKGEQLKFRIILIGSAVDYLAYFIFVFDQIGKYAGFGKSRREGFGRFKICEVRDDFAGKRVIYNGNDKILLSGLNIKRWQNLICVPENDKKIESATLTFVTPVRIRHNGRYLFLHENDNFSAGMLIKTIFSRAFLLSAGHCRGNREIGEAPDFSAVRISKMNLEWYDWQRYSSRQKEKHPFGGFIGQVTVTGVTKDFIQLLRLGEILHIGSGTAFGLGKYVLAVG